MKKIIMLSSLLALAACQTPSSTSPQASETAPNPTDLKREWRVSQLGNLTAAQLRDGVMDWRDLPNAYANMGCNDLNFKVEIQASGSLKVGGVMATRMLCENKMAVESAFSQQITQMNRYRLENGQTLILSSPSGETIRFVAK